MPAIRFVGLPLQRDKMSHSRYFYFLSVMAALSAAPLISGYSFHNCLRNHKLRAQSFTCIHRTTSNLRDYVSDLPPFVLILNISHNPIKHIPNYTFANLTRMQSLRMDNNQLSFIDQFAFHNLHHLRNLNLSFNNISYLNQLVFSDLHNLTFLSLTNNTLKKLPEGIFSSNFNLETIILEQNNLKNFSEIVQSVSHLPKLKKLDLSVNFLTSLWHSNTSLPRTLAHLYLSRNKLATLSCQSWALGFIHALDLSYNYRLPTRAFQGVDLRNVHYLRLRSTSINVTEFLSVSNIRARFVDFSGTGQKNGKMLTKLCELLKRKETSLRNLTLAANEIEYLPNSTLYHCPKITGSLDLSHNRIKNSNCLKFLRGHKDIKSINLEHNLLTFLQSCYLKDTKVDFQYLEKLSYRYNRILSVKSSAFQNAPNIKTLQLNINNIAFLASEAFKGLTELRELRLDNNLITDLFSNSFEDNVKLQTLNLRNNRIAVIFNGTFHRLENLTILDLGGNKITHFYPSGFDGLKSLSKLYLDGNNLVEIDSSLYRVFQHTLTVLDLARNQIHFFSRITSSPFMHLKNLIDLKLDGQQPYGLMVLPTAFFRGLHSLRSLYLTNNNLNGFASDAFEDLVALRFLSLDNCCVGVPYLQPGTFGNLRNLTRLIVENMGIQNFSKEVFGNLTNLGVLQLNRNVMQSIPVDVLQSLPKLRYLDIRNIPLSCTCQNSLLQNWTVNNPKVQLAELYDLKCKLKPNVKFYNFDTKVCKLDLGHVMFLITAAVTFLFTIVPLLYDKLYWKFKYGYYVFRSWFSEQWRRLREEEENCKYDAFISYNSSDEEWVMDQLVPNLEGNGSSFKLCLHHRDFELGRNIVDNIVTAVYSSRKTICVVSRNFLQSEWCSLEIQLASYRLFDEHRDVLLLVFLEPLTERQVSSYHRMRKVMLKKTYLQWPVADCSDPAQAQQLFWKQLRRAMMTGSKLQTEENIIHDEEDEELELYADEDNYLQP